MRNIVETQKETGEILHWLKSAAIGHAKFNLNMMKVACPAIIPFISRIINCLIERGVFPTL